MPENIDIRPVVISDHYQDISEMMRELHVHERSLFDKTAPWTEIEAGYMRHVIQLQRDCDGTCLVAYEDGLPVGFIFGYIEEQDDSRIEVYMGKELYVSDGYVREDRRGSGIYRKLNEQLEAIYVEKGVRRICRHTLVNNTRARHFFEKQGYFVTRLLYEKWL